MSKPHKVVPRNKGEIKANNTAKRVMVSGLTNPHAMMDWWIRDFKSDLEKMNAGKVGAPYRYTDKLMHWALIVKSFFNDDYQGATAYIESLLGWVMETNALRYLPCDFRCPDFTTIFRRMNGPSKHLFQTLTLDFSGIRNN